MKKALCALGVASLCFSSLALAEPHWSYEEGADGPHHWGELASEYNVCGNGKNQTPVDITGTVKADLKPLKFNYHVGGTKIVNNGHTIQLIFDPGNTLRVDGQAFELQQLHFHNPSENHVNGKAFPMEMHLVHADKDGNLAVVAVLFKEGAANQTLAALWKSMPEQAGDPQALPKAILPTGLLPAQRDYYRLNGSLTTPPCSEGVRWFVLKHPIMVSPAQIEQFARVMGHPTNRPIQDLNGRVILE